MTLKRDFNVLIERTTVLSYKDMCSFFAELDRGVQQHPRLPTPILSDIQLLLRYFVPIISGFHQFIG